MFLSVIIPCYNAEPWMARCLDSILNQGVDDMEVICVNDGSKDDTLAILRDYETRYPNVVKVIDKENGGVSSARNVGIDAATGTYITFVDADDTLVDGALPGIIKIISSYEQSPEVVHCGMRIISRNGESETDVHRQCEFGLIDINYLISLPPLSFGSPCSKLYLNRLLKEYSIRFDEAMPLYEDEYFNTQLLNHVTYLLITNVVLYNYIRNDSSATNRFRGDKFVECNLKINNCRKSFYIDLHKREDYNEILKRRFAFDSLFSLYSIYRDANVKKRCKWLTKYWSAANEVNSQWSYQLDSGVPKVVGILGRKSKFLCHIWLSAVFGVERIKRKLSK